MTGLVPATTKAGLDAQLVDISDAVHDRLHSVPTLPTLVPQALPITAGAS